MHIKMLQAPEKGLAAVLLAPQTGLEPAAFRLGDYLALRDGKLFGTDPDENALLRALAESAAQSDPSFLSLYYGEDVTEEQAAAASAIFREACPGAELSVLSGGQPVYYYIISVE